MFQIDGNLLSVILTLIFILMKQKENIQIKKNGKLMIV
jgi:hypothetical protein